MGGESSRHVEGSGTAPDVVVSLYDQFPTDPPIVLEAAVSSGDARRRVDESTTRVQKLTTSQKSSLWVDLRNSSVATSSTSFNSVSGAQIRSEYGVTPYSP